MTNSTWVMIVLLILYFVILAFIDTDETLIIQPDTALVLRPYGNVVEQYSGTPLDLAFQQLTEQARTETRLRDMAVSIRPGAITLTLMRSPATSRARDFEKPITPALAAA